MLHIELGRCQVSAFLFIIPITEIALSADAAHCVDGLRSFLTLMSGSFPPNTNFNLQTVVFLTFFCITLALFLEKKYYLQEIDEGTTHYD